MAIAPRDEKSKAHTKKQQETKKRGNQNEKQKTKKHPQKILQVTNAPQGYKKAPKKTKKKKEEKDIMTQEGYNTPKIRKHQN